MKKKTFPDDFLWGASTSAYQVEGAAYEDGKKASQQDIINKDSYKVYGFATAEVASDQYHHYKEDVAMMKEMGFTAYRFSIAWSRVFPDGTGEVNEKGIQYYRDLIDELLKNGIEPIVTLYHYDCPWALVEKYGGWLDRQIVRDFEYYARYIINEFKDKVKIWTTINEQSVIVQYWTQKCYIPEEYLGQTFEVKIRYAAKPALAVLTESANKGMAVLSFEDAQRGPTPGQYAVLYKDDLVIGCGIIY